MALMLVHVEVAYLAIICSYMMEYRALAIKIFTLIICNFFF